MCYNNLMTNYLIYTLAIILALAPALFWLYIWYRKDSVEPEPKQMIFRAFFLGMLAIMPFLGLAHIFEYTPTLNMFWLKFSANFFYLSLVVSVVILAWAEETVKHFAVLQLGSRLKIEFNQIVDGIIYSISAALGFAFMENIFYFTEALITGGINTAFWPIFAFRSFGTMLGHTIFSGIFGLFWGYAFLDNKICPHHTKSVKSFFHQFTETIKFHIIIKHIIMGKLTEKGHEKRQLVAEALLLATIVHAIFNLLIKFEVFGHSLTFLVVPIIMGGFLYLSHAFLIKRNIKIWETVKN